MPLRIALRVIRISAFYDLAVTVAFAFTATATLAFTGLGDLHRAVGLSGATPDPAEPCTMMFANPMGSVADRARVKVFTVRFYERRGFLAQPRRTAGGYRNYDDASLQHLRFLRRGQELGFTLTELTEFTGLSSQLRSGSIAAASVTATAAAKLEQIDARIADLHRTREAIGTLLDQQCIDPNASCPIVGTLAGPTTRATNL